MRLRNVIRVSILASCIGAGPGLAQTLSETNGPREYPPASFTGKQYVDSDGCVFVRAGFAGQVRWVPRVGRDRKLICGYQPTLAAPATEVVEVPQTEVAPQSVTIAPETRATVAPAPSRTTVERPRRVAPPPAEQAAPPPIITAEPMRQRRSIFALLFGPARYVGTASGAPLVVAAEVVPVWQTACPTIAAAAQRYFLADGRRLIRCSGDTSNPNGFVRRLDLSAVPVVEVQATRGTMSGKDRVSIPKGFKPAFTDGRFNRKRGVGTDAGQRQMELIWTNTVPRRLVDKRTGREVTRRQVAVSSKTAPDAAFAQPKSKSAKSISANFVSANSTSASYVQVGTFGVPANAAALVKRFQRMGLPVAISKTHMGGRPVEVVLAGPFNDRTRLTAALATARRAGFSDAFIR